MDQVFEQRSVEDGRGLEFLSGDGSADDGENAGANDSADAERSKAKPAERFLEAGFWIFRVGDKFVDTFAAKER